MYEAYRFDGNGARAHGSACTGLFVHVTEKLTVVTFQVVHGSSNRHVIIKYVEVGS